MSNVLGTSFATSGFTWDPNLSPNNQSFAMAVLAVGRRAGFGSGGTGGGGSGSVTSVAGTSIGTGSSALVITGSPITTSGTLTFAVKVFDGTNDGVVNAASGGTLAFLRADGTFATPPGSGVTGVDAVMAGAGTSCGTWSNQHITTSGTATLQLNAFNGTLAGLVPSSAGGVTNFLRADGSFAAPPGSFTGVSGTVTGAGTAAVQISNVPLSSAGTFTLTINTFAGTNPGVVPSSPGGTGSFLQTDGAWAQPQITGAGVIQVTTIVNSSTATTTWTANANTTAIRVVVIAGGASGGGGAAGTGTGAGGGAGGSPGGVSIADFLISDVGTSVVCSFSATQALGGAGGTGANGTGTNGVAGANAQFGTFLGARGGGLSTGGKPGSGSSNGATGAVGQGATLGNVGGSNGGSGSSANAPAVIGPTTVSLSPWTNIEPTGGGGGGGVNNANGAGAGAAGGDSDLANNQFYTLKGGAFGAAGGANPGQNGNSGGPYRIGSGGGGGGGNASGNGGAGGNGANYGAGGGGGGAAGQGTLGNGGPGGNGGPAAIIIIEYGVQSAALAIGGNPSVKVSTTATNGVATTWMRSDAAPAIDQAMAPTWTGLHTFNAVEPQIVVGSSTAYAWGTGTHYPTIQMAGVGALFGTGTIGLILTGGGLYYNGTKYIYGQAGTGIIQTLGTGSFTISCVSTAGTAAGTATLTTVFSIGGTVTSNKIQGYGPTAAALVDMTPDTGAFTGTHAGFTATITSTCAWSKQGNQVTLTIGTATGSSNATTWTMNGLPAAIQPTRTQTVPLFSLVDNGAAVAGGIEVVAANGTMTFLKSSGAAWTSSGAKALQISAQSFTYQLS